MEDSALRASLDAATDALDFGLLSSNESTSPDLIAMAH